MARIRSIHPGIATDEAFMQMSAYCKAVWPMLWTECDDNGVFEWKPVVLKARLLPADSVDFEDILLELESLDCIRRITVAGREYGLVRNFRKFQRPRKPNNVHPLPPEYRTYVGLEAASAEPVPHKSEKSPQMEDVGGRMDSEPEGSAPDGPAQSDHEKIWDSVNFIACKWNMPESRVRNLIGRACKHAGGDGRVLGLLREAYAEKPVDLDSWLMRRLQPRASPPDRPRVDTDALAREIAGEA